MRSRCFVLLAAGVLVAAACGDGGATTEPSTEPSTEPAPSTSTTSAVAPTTTAPQPAPSTTELSAPLHDGQVALGPPDPELLPGVSPPEQLDWATVGEGWLLIDHPWGHGGPFIEPTVLDQRGLYLLSPNDAVFGASAVPSDGRWIEAVSQDGRQVLFRLNDPVCAQGCSSDTPVTEEADGFALLDLPTTTLRTVIEPVTQWVFEPDFSRRARFTDDGAGLWVSETWLVERGWVVTRVRLSRLDLTSGAWTTILDDSTNLDLLQTYGDRTDHGHASVVELPDGRLVTESPAGVWLRSPDGAAVERLDAPDTTCVLTRLWDPDHVLARCQPPDVDPGCWTTGLWRVAIDGGPSTVLAIPTELPDEPRGCFYNYFDAVQLGDATAVQAGEGEGSCGYDVVFLAPDGVHPWEHDVEGPEGCVDEFLLGIRNDAWLIGTSVGATFEVDADGNHLVELPPGEIFPI